MSNFATMFPPEMWLPNAGMFSMIENDVVDRAERILSYLHHNYDNQQPFDKDIITDTLHRYGLEWDMLPTYIQDEIDEFDVVD